MVTSKFKYGFAGIFTLLVTAGALAFQAPKSSEQNIPAIEWFQYLGNLNGGGITNPENYELVVSPENCDEGGFRCAIRAEEDSANPGFPTQAGVNSPETIETRSTPPTP